MTSARIFIGIAIFALFVGGMVVWAQSNTGVEPASAYPVDIASGETLYGEYCAACHGANLEGQGDWRSPGADGLLPAPPHDETGHTWHHADSLLFTYTKLGGRETLAQQGMDFNSGMPGFGDQLSDEDIWNILAFIKSSWPERLQQIQAERTAADIASQGDE
jgi:mono/diheme cytochrome c family protein